ncbi:MAG: class I SAM-dependent methyltransferase [Methanotrichaceae archaeon]
MAFKWEARYKIVNYLLKAHHINQILEIASGVSPRGLEMARDPSVEYVEVDLIDAIQVKKDIIKRLIAKSIVSKQPNLHLEEGNALNLQDLLKATRFFGERPIAVVNEGFLDYLDLEEKTIFARNVHRLLERFGGIWITPDIPTKAQDEQVVSSVKHLLSNETLQERAGNIRRITGVDILKNRFESEDVAQTFFENLGFIVEQHRSSEVIDELVSPQKGNQRLEEVEKVIRPMAVFVMEIDPSKS